MIRICQKYLVLSFVFITGFQMEVFSQVEPKCEDRIYYRLSAEKRMDPGTSIKDSKLIEEDFYIRILNDTLQATVFSYDSSINRYCSLSGEKYWYSRDSNFVYLNFHSFSEVKTLKQFPLRRGDSIVAPLEFIFMDQEEYEVNSYLIVYVGNELWEHNKRAHDILVFCAYLFNSTTDEVENDESYYYIYLLKESLLPIYMVGFRNLLDEKNKIISYQIKRSDF